MLQEDPRFQSLPIDWKKSAIAQEGISKQGENEESQEVHMFNLAQWKRCLDAMELYSLCQHGPRQRYS